MRTVTTNTATLDITSIVDAGRQRAGASGSDPAFGRLLDRELAGPGADGARGEGGRPADDIGGLRTDDLPALDTPRSGGHQRSARGTSGPARSEASRHRDSLLGDDDPTATDPYAVSADDRSGAIDGGTGTTAAERSRDDSDVADDDDDHDEAEVAAAAMPITPVIVLVAADAAAVPADATDESSDVLVTVAANAVDAIDALDVAAASLPGASAAVADAAVVEAPDTVGAGVDPDQVGGTPAGSTDGSIVAPDVDLPADATGAVPGAPTADRDRPTPAPDRSASGPASAATPTSVAGPHAGTPSVSTAAAQAVPVVPNPADAATMAVALAAEVVADGSGRSESSGTATTRVGGSAPDGGAGVAVSPSVSPAGDATRTPGAAAAATGRSATPSTWSATTSSAASTAAGIQLRAGTLEMDLGGEGLGPLRVQARNHAGSLHLTLTGADATVMDTIGRHAGELRREIAAAGIDLGSLDLSGRSPDHGSGRADGNAGDDPGRSGGRSDAGATDRRLRLGGSQLAPVGVDTTIGRPGGDRGLDLRI